MISKIVILGLGTLLLSGSAFAQEMKKCDDKTFEMVMKEVEGAPAAKKEMAMAELKMAKDKMAAKMTKDCAMHLDNASKASMN